MAEILEGLNDRQLEAARHGEGPLLIVAGAGTGKTTVVTRRIAYLIEQGVKPEEILALAFGEKAAAEMEERVDELLPLGYANLQISTFHSFGETALREYGLEIGLPDFKVLDEVQQWLLVRNHLDRFDLDYYRPLGNPTRFVKALVDHFARAKDELVSPQGYLDYAEKLRLASDRAEAGAELLTEESAKSAEVANAYHVYQKLLLEQNALDFGDLINYTLKLFTERKNVLAFYRRRFKYILIDEFQDTNFAQYELIKLLAAPNNNLTVVGDDDQSIFKFRGASISNILHFQKDYPKAKFISLTDNYRSPQNLLDLAHKFVSQNNPDRLEVKLKLPKRLQARGGEKEALITEIKTPDGAAEAEAVADRILQLKSEDPDATWNNFAILSRSHDALEPFLSELDERTIPYIYFASRGLYRKNIILDLLSYFKLLDNYHESQALYRVLNFPKFKIARVAIIELAHFARRKTLSLYGAMRQAAGIAGLDESSLAGIRQILELLDRHGELAKTKSVDQVFRAAVNDLDFVSKLSENPEQVKYMETFGRKIQRFLSESPDKSLKRFLSQIAFEQEAGSQGELEFDPEAGPEAVRLMTVHGAKGLEFKYVFVVNLVDKRFPSIDRRDPIELPEALIKDILPQGDIHLEEERRLFYVAMTRARKGLSLTRALDYGGKLRKKPSRFLYELGLVRDDKDEEKAAAKKEVVRRPLTGLSKAMSVLPLSKYFSFSQISVFRKCPLQYKYRYVLKLPEIGSAQLSFGLTVHNTLEKYLRGLKQKQNQSDLFGKAEQNPIPPPENLSAIFSEAWIDDWYESKRQAEEYRRRGEEILKYFYEECKSRQPRPKYLETKFKLKLNDSWIVGKMDRADETAVGLVIIDYKTGAPRPIEKVDKDQLLLYQWAAQDFLGENVADLQYWFLWDKLKKEQFLGKIEDIEKLKSEFCQTVEEIKQAAREDIFAAWDRRISHKCDYREFEV